MYPIFFSIKLFITSRGGCIDSAIVPIFVKVNDVPVITGITRVDTACSNQLVQYRGFVTAIDSIPPTNYVWNYSSVIITSQGRRDYKSAFSTPYAFFFIGFGHDIHDFGFLISQFDHERGGIDAFTLDHVLDVEIHLGEF